MIKTVMTKLSTHKGTIGHTGTSGFTVTGTRAGDRVDTLIEYSEMKHDEMREMVAVLLCMLEDLEGEEFVTSCFARYAQEMGKPFLDMEDGRKLGIIRGERSKK